jgi:hypothetical protein
MTESQIREILIANGVRPDANGEFARNVWNAALALVKAASGAGEPNAWLRSDGLKAMPADEKDAWIRAGKPSIVDDYTIPLYTTPPAAVAPVALTDEQRANAARWEFAMDWGTKDFAVCKRVGDTGQCWAPIKSSGPIDAAIELGIVAQKGGE